MGTSVSQKGKSNREGLSRNYGRATTDLANGIPSAVSCMGNNSAQPESLNIKPLQGSNFIKKQTSTLHNYTHPSNFTNLRQHLPGPKNHKYRIITAVQKYRTFAGGYLYIFPINNEYIRYNIPKSKAMSEPIRVDDNSWPDLFATE
jgi:hypothetical protein